MANVNVVLNSKVQDVFTKAVEEYLGQGMTYHIASMNGTQGELAKVDLTNGQDVYRIALKSETCFDDDFWGDMISLTVEVFKGMATDKIKFGCTLWNGRGEVIFKKNWYQIAGSYRDNNVWVETIEEARECQKERFKRSESNTTRDNEVTKISVRTEEERTFVRDICREHRGYGRVKRAHIAGIEKARNRINGSVTYKVMFTDECGKAALVIKRVSARG